MCKATTHPTRPRPLIVIAGANSPGKVSNRNSAQPSVSCLETVYIYKARNIQTYKHNAEDRKDIINFKKKSWSFAKLNLAARAEAAQLDPLTVTFS